MKCILSWHRRLACYKSIRKAKGPILEWRVPIAEWLPTVAQADSLCYTAGSYKQ